jgi:hypothetical protein
MSPGKASGRFGFQRIGGKVKAALTMGSAAGALSPIGANISAGDMIRRAANQRLVDHLRC